MTTAEPEVCPYTEEQLADIRILLRVLRRNARIKKEREASNASS